MKILLVDDHHMIRAGIRTFLDENEAYDVVAEGKTGREAIELYKETKPDLIISDIMMPDLDGIGMTQKIRESDDQVRIVAFSMLSESYHIKQMMKAGANGYLLKNCTESELDAAISAVMDGQTYYSKDVMQSIILDDNKKPEIKQRLSHEIPLTTREMEVLHLICKEYSNAEISEELFIGMRTVDAHKRNLLEKTGCKNVAGLVIYAVERNLFDDL
ncbi:response regulator transcription factor [Reichenbachiella ulvae]|uniref:Response regulator transcription factor n=1 Tax=Reichenbachiella ulvae TaxID=2980104 RepID=A0ABT3CP90_9BACT|nr:response regulator transcription factor [Reichenbachiella ulvae]MCV9385550.1 response regulator transcription factor [Reichenbachiella ulvae]